jgi:hypothetical protein
MSLRPFLTTTDLDAAIASDEERLADCRLDVEDCEEVGLDTARAQSLVRVVEDHLALLKERRGRLLQEQIEAL